MSSATVCKRGGGGRGGGMSRGAGMSRRGMHSGASRSANNAAAAHAASYIDPQLTCQQFWDVNRDMLRKLGVSGPASINVSIEKDAKGWRIRFVLPHLSLVSCKSLQKQQLATSYKKAHHKERKVLVIIESDAAATATTSVADTLRDWGLSVEDGPARPAGAGAAATPVSNKPARPALAEISNARVPPPFTHHARPARDLLHGHSTPQPMGSWASAGTCTPPPRSQADSNSPRPDMPGMLMPGLVSLPSSAASTPCNGPHVAHELPPLYSMDTAPDTSVSLASLSAPLSVSQRKSMSPKALRMLPPSRHVPPPAAAAAAAAAPAATATTAAASTVKVPPSHYHPPSAPVQAQALVPQQPQPQQQQQAQAQAQAVAPQATTHNPYGTSPMSVSAQPQPQPCLQPTSLSSASPHVPTPTSAQRACPAAAAATSAAAAAPIPVPTLQQQGVTHLPCATANESVTIVDAARSTTTFSVMQTSADSKLVWSGGVNGHTIVKKVTLNYGSRIELQVDSNTVCLHFPDALESVKKLKQMCEKLKTVACNIDLQWKANDACWKRTTTTNNETRMQFDPYGVPPEEAPALVSQPPQLQAPQQQQQQQQPNTPQRTALPQQQPLSANRLVLPESNFMPSSVPIASMPLVLHGNPAFPVASAQQHAASPQQLATPQRSEAATDAHTPSSSVKKLNPNAVAFIPGGSPTPSKGLAICSPAKGDDDLVAFDEPKAYKFVAMDEVSHKVFQSPSKQSLSVRSLQHEETVNLLGISTDGGLSWGKLADREWCVLSDPAEGRTYLREV